MGNQKPLDRLRAMFAKSVDDQEYEPLSGDEDDVRRPASVTTEEIEEAFSYFEYSIFFVLGIAMLWAWYIPSSLCRGAHANQFPGICS